ncbi:MULTISPECIES: heme exporter protein CcmB [Actinobacillus]|uniref:Heme exporter protein B n=3 Tax=Actinobacillus pleuropneumoniae TaxID=715 RepID=A3N219_ACTP2|nr:MULTISPECIES: heme exporter protein CcmB [Actinobacillus]ABN74455.1 heme exporter protein B [Actinobacillus pleuropneumoniae serovar 5b str. L20]ABY69945.1 cytochrome c-type biogenesis protein [Actinobacillus pleuropneumoniae serovar 3 str. JL03]EFN00289.1 Heme exporter protein CcmB [Actinobacillus pleuropneumoniae serovar 12 str. 1096]MCL7720737.1 heme exporter protein CcmB [Actinobacillus pleuropneumoniae]MCL7728557.1 heme exporter protein CcmB [Actinobacillus pleuropneumoniae]
MILFTIIQRELTIALRKPAEILNPLWFFLIVITLFPLLMGPNPELLGKIAPGVAWVAALLSALLSFERLFRDDYLDGSLEQLMLLPIGLPQVALAKVIAHWLLTGLPLILLSPVAAILLSLETNVWWALVLTLLLGTPILSCLGAIGVALTVGLRKGGTLLSLLILPLFLPVLIFAAAVLEAATLNMGYSGQLAIIGAILALTLTFSPFAIAGALRISLQ